MADDDKRPGKPGPSKPIYGPDNVVVLDCVTRLDLPPERVLARALEVDLESVVIVGQTKDGEEYFASSLADGGTVIYHLQRGIWALNKMIDGDEE